MGEYQKSSILIASYHLGRWIRRESPNAWPPHSPDLTPLDLFLGSIGKPLVYETNSQPKNTSYQDTSSMDEIHAMRKVLSGRVYQNVLQRRYAYIECGNRQF